MFRDLFGDDKAASSKNKTSGLQAKLKALARFDRYTTF